MAIDIFRKSKFLGFIRQLITKLHQDLRAEPDNKKKLKLILTQVLGFDRAVAWINLSNMWSLVKAPFTLFFIVTYLSFETQGLWYTFNNLAALSVFAELGFTLIITQFISHEYARLNMKDGQLQGDEHYIARLISLAIYAIKFYLVVVLLAIIILSVVGGFYFHNQPKFVLGAWIFFSLTSGLNLFLSLLLAIYRGLDKVAQTQKAMLKSAIVGTLITWLALYSGFNIWAIPLGSAAGALVMIFSIIRIAPDFWIQIFRYRQRQQFNWSHEILVLQGRYAVSFASGYFVFYLIVPAVFKIEGAVTAGQLGLTIAVIAAIQSIATSSVVSNIPKLNMLIGTGQHKKAYQLAIKNTIISVFLYILGTFLLIVIIWYMNNIGKLHNRFLPFPLFFLVLSYQLSPLLTSSIGFYVRAHKKEPFMPIAIICGAIIAISIFTILPHYGLFWLLIIFNFIFWVISVPWTFWIFKSYIKRYKQIPNIT